MKMFDWIAAAVFFLQLPNPLFWLIVHPQVKRWRGHVRAAYVTALLVAWGLVTIFLAEYHRIIFTHVRPGNLQTGAGLLLIALDLWLFARVRRDLGTSRLIGKPELSRASENCGNQGIACTGIYARIRHPRYTGMICSVAGACLLAATKLMWAIAGIWLLLVFIVIAFEERELRARFGPAYAKYCDSVPRFIPGRATKPAKP
ncbi:MAG TPA: isoprenylcysteine carboxylmethyltransferase family protein [Candidatus Acidoferrales bacterium]|nr:isoprenylcysteine carboxylmethyltransferase family protein [Candidatus Acidoferrales bacterium]